MAGLLDLFGGGGSSADDPYADILTPAQRNQMQTQGLLAMAAAFAEAGMPSRLPIPFGAALGKAAGALGAGQEAGMTAALANAARAQQIRDLRSKAATRAKLDPILQTYLSRVQAWAAGGGAGPAPTPPAGGGGGGGGGTAPAAPAGDQPPMMDLPYPEGLLGGDVGAAGEYGTGGATGLLGAAPPVVRAAAARAAPSGQIPGYPSIRSNAAGQADRAYIEANPPAASGGGLLGPGVGGGSSAADLGAGGDEPAPRLLPLAETPWGPTWPQGGAGSRGPSRGETPEMTRLIEQAAAERNIPPEVLRGLIQVESSFKPNIVSPAGAVGLAQLMPGTARGLGVTDPTDPAQAIPAGAQYLRQGLDKYSGDINKALMYYHGGPDERIWGPRTQAYPGAVLAAAGRPAPSTTEGSGGGEAPQGWGPTWPGGAGGPPLAPPGSLPALPAPGAAPPLGAGGKIPGLGITPQELAIVDAMAESAGLGNPFKGLLDTFYKTPGYLEEAGEATERGKAKVTFPLDLVTRQYQSALDRANKEAEQLGAAKNDLTKIPVSDGRGGVIEIQGTREQAVRAANGLAVPELGIPGLVKPPAGGGETGTPAAGTPVGEPVRTPGQTKSEEAGATAGWKALEDTHAVERAAIRSDQQLGQMAEAMKGFTPGATADLRIRGQAILRDLGLIKGDEVPSAETFQRMARQMQISANATKGQGAVSDYERSLMAEAAIQMGNTPEGIAKAIGIMQRLNEYDKAVARIHRDVATEGRGMPNVLEAQRRIAALGPPLSPGEISALETIRAGKVPAPEAASPGGRGWKEGDVVNYPDGSKAVVRNGQWVTIPAQGR